EANLTNEDYRTRQLAMGLLGLIGQRDKNAVLPKLLELASHQNPVFREEALSGLGSLKRDPAATEMLLRALHDEDRHVRLVAAWHLGSRRPFEKAAIPVLLEFLEDPNSDGIMRRSIVELLSGAGIGNAQVDRAVLNIFQSSEDPSLRIAAASALVAIA